MADTEEHFLTGAADEFDGDEEGDEGVEETTEGAAPAGPEDPFEQLHKFHPETILDYAETVIPKVPLQSAPPIDGSDPNHRSPPFLTVYERTKILGTRANQIAEGARPFIDPVPEHITQPLEIAKLELEQRRLPFIIKRPMPDGTFEYWRLSDLLLI
jgi:DNA-directed RNA polymerase I, II, and III subunit RPABC2